MHSSADDKQSSLQAYDHNASTSYAGMVVRLNNTSDTMTAAGWGTTAETSTAAFYDAGSPDQRVIAVMRFVTPTTAANCNMGVMLRAQSLDATGDTDYYYIRVSSGNAQIVLFIDGASAGVLSQSAFVLPVDTDVTIDCTIRGATITATFTASGVPTVDLATVDTTITGTSPQRPGRMGARCLSRTMLVQTFAAEYL